MLRPAEKKIEKPPTKVAVLLLKQTFHKQIIVGAVHVENIN
jgi:hypothetical protein